MTKPSGCGPEQQPVTDTELIREVHAALEEEMARLPRPAICPLWTT